MRLDDNPTVTTQEVDIEALESIKTSIGDEVDSVLADALKDLKLSPVPDSICEHKPTRWAMQGGKIMIDFITPKALKSNDVLMLGASGVYARALSFLNFLIAKPIPALGLYCSGVLVQIPRPERYAIHKLIVAQRRTGDLHQNHKRTSRKRKILFASSPKTALTP